jgi:hypothetical protein
LVTVSADNRVTLKHGYESGRSGRYHLEAEKKNFVGACNGTICSLDTNKENGEIRMSTNRGALGFAATAIVLAWLMACPAITSAQNCAAVLQKTDLNRVTTFSQKLAIFTLVKTEDDWNKSINGNAQFETLFGASFSEYQKRKQSMENEASTRLETSTAESLVTSFLPGNAIDAWKACVSHSALSAWFSNATENSFSLFVQWNPPLSGKFHIPAPVTQGGSIVGKIDLPIDVAGPFSTAVIVNRDTEKEFRFVMAVGDYHIDLFLPKVPIPYELKCSLPLDDFVTIAAGGDDQNQGVKNYYCRGMEPGKSFDVDMNGSFHIDNPGPGGGWVTMEGSVTGGNSVNGGHCFGQAIANGKECNMIGGTSSGSFPVNWHLSGKVPADGVVVLTIHISRAYDQTVHQHSLTSDSGNVNFAVR